MPVNTVRKRFTNLIKTTIRSLINKLGIDIIQMPKVGSTGAKDYEMVHPVATYCPWNKDALFQRTFGIIQKFSLVDQYRCFELWKLVEQSAKLSAGSIIEIGVWRGGTGALMARQAKQCGIREKVYLCDTFTGVVKADVKDSRYKGGEHSDTSQATVEGLVGDRLGLDNVKILKGIFPDDTGHLVANQKFRLCHVDVDVYQSAKEVIHWIWDKMVPGGIMVYDDYGFYGCDGITKYVEEQMQEKDRFVYHNLNGHAVIVKR